MINRRRGGGGGGVIIKNVFFVFCYFLATAVAGFSVNR